MSDSHTTRLSIQLPQSPSEANFFKINPVTERYKGLIALDRVSNIFKDLNEMIAEYTNELSSKSVQDRFRINDLILLENDLKNITFLDEIEEFLKSINSVTDSEPQDSYELSIKDIRMTIYLPILVKVLISKKSQGKDYKDIIERLNYFVEIINQDNQIKNYPFKYATPYITKQLMEVISDFSIESRKIILNTARILSVKDSFGDEEYIKTIHYELRNLTLRYDPSAIDVELNNPSLKFLHKFELTLIKEDNTATQKLIKDLPEIDITNQNRIIPLLNNHISQRIINNPNEGIELYKSFSKYFTDNPRTKFDKQIGERISDFSNLHELAISIIALCPDVLTLYPDILNDCWQKLVEVLKDDQPGIFNRFLAFQNIIVNKKILNVDQLNDLDMLVSKFLRAGLSLDNKEEDVISDNLKTTADDLNQITQQIKDGDLDGIESGINSINRLSSILDSILSGNNLSKSSPSIDTFTKGLEIAMLTPEKQESQDFVIATLDKLNEYGDRIALSQFTSLKIGNLYGKLCMFLATNLNGNRKLLRIAFEADLRNIIANEGSGYIDLATSDSFIQKEFVNAIYTNYKIMGSNKPINKDTEITLMFILHQAAIGNYNSIIENLRFFINEELIRQRDSIGATLQEIKFLTNCLEFVIITMLNDTNLKDTDAKSFVSFLSEEVFPKFNNQAPGDPTLQMATSGDNYGETYDNSVPITGSSSLRLKQIIELLDLLMTPAREKKLVQMAIRRRNLDEHFGLITDSGDTDAYLN